MRKQLNNESDEVLVFWYDPEWEKFWPEGKVKTFQGIPYTEITKVGQEPVASGYSTEVGTGTMADTAIRNKTYNEKLSDSMSSTKLVTNISRNPNFKAHNNKAEDSSLKDRLFGFFK